MLSGIYYITGRRRKRKGSVGPFRYNYYCEPTKDPVLIRDLIPIIACIRPLFANPVTNRNDKKVTKQDIRYYSIDSKGQDNIQLLLQSLKLQIRILTLYISG